MEERKTWTPNNNKFAEMGDKGMRARKGTALNQVPSTTDNIATLRQLRSPVRIPLLVKFRPK